MTLTKNKKIIRAARAKARLHLRGALCVAVVIIGSLYVASETLSASPRSTIASEVRRLSNATAEELCQPSGGNVRTEFFYSVGFSLVLLILMLISVIVTIAMSGWRMTKGLGYSMFGLYLCFVVIEIIRAYT